MKNLICLMALLLISTNSFAAAVSIPGAATYRKMKRNAEDLKLRLKYAGHRDWTCKINAKGQKKIARIQLVRNWNGNDEISGYVTSKELGLRGNFSFLMTENFSELRFLKKEGYFAGEKQLKHAIKKVKAINVSHKGIQVSCKKQ